MKPSRILDGDQRERHFIRQLHVAAVMLALFCLSLAANAQANHPLRVVSLTAPAAELMYTLGAEDELVGVSDSCVFPDRIMDDRKSGRVRVVGGFINIDISVVESLKPNLIITSTSLQVKLAQELRAKGYQVLHVDPNGLEDIFSSFEQIGEAIGKGTQAKKITAEMRSDLRAIEAKSHSLPPVRVYVELNHEGPWTTGGSSFVNDAIRAAGGRNVFGEDSRGILQTTNDEIRKRDPEVILSPIWRDAKIGGIDGITTIAEITSRPGFTQIKAVRNSRVLYYDSALLKHGGPREVLAIRKLAHLLHPNEFSDPPDTIPWELGRIQ